MFHLVQEGGRAEEGNVLVPAQADAEQMVETDEVVHVGVGNEYGADFEDHAGRQSRDISQIEEKCFVMVLEFYVDRRVVEGRIYQRRVHHH